MTGKVDAELGRLERQILGTLKLYAREQHHRLSDLSETISELFGRLISLENEVHAIIQREAAHGKES